MIMHDIQEKITSHVLQTPAAISPVFCKLFSDSVTTKTCELRKRELNGSGGFSCTGCSLKKI